MNHHISGQISTLKIDPNLSPVGNLHLLAPLFNECVNFQRSEGVIPNKFSGGSFYNVGLFTTLHPHLTTGKQRFRPLGHDGLTTMCGLLSYRIMGYTLIKPLRDKKCQIDNSYMCTETDCDTKSTFLIPMLFLASMITVYRTLYWISNHNWVHTCHIVTCQFFFIKLRYFKIIKRHLISNQCGGRAV